MYVTKKPKENQVLMWIRQFKSISLAANYPLAWGRLSTQWMCVLSEAKQAKSRLISGKKPHQVHKWYTISVHFEPKNKS